MTERREPNITEQLQIRHRNFRDRDLHGSYAIDPFEESEPVIGGTPRVVDEERRAKYHKVTEAHIRAVALPDLEKIVGSNETERLQRKRRNTRARFLP